MSTDVTEQTAKGYALIVGAVAVGGQVKGHRTTFEDDFLDA